MPTLYDAIKAEWKKVSDAMPEGSSLEVPPHIQPRETLARQLDARYADAINPLIDQYAEGLISSTELLDKMAYEAGKEV